MVYLRMIYSWDDGLIRNNESIKQPRDPPAFPLEEYQEKSTSNNVSPETSKLDLLVTAC